LFSLFKIPLIGKNPLKYNNTLIKQNKTTKTIFSTGLGQLVYDRL